MNTNAISRSSISLDSFLPIHGWVSGRRSYLIMGMHPERATVRLPYAQHTISGKHLCVSRTDGFDLDQRLLPLACPTRSHATGISRDGLTVHSHCSHLSSRSPVSSMMALPLTRLALPAQPLLFLLCPPRTRQMFELVRISIDTFSTERAEKGGVCAEVWSIEGQKIETFRFEPLPDLQGRSVLLHGTWQS